MHRMMIENLILDGLVQTLLSENGVKIPLSEMKMFASQNIRNCLKKSFACKLNCLKQSLFWCHYHSTHDHRRISLPISLPFESLFLGACAFQNVLAESGMEIRNNDS